MLHGLTMDQVLALAGFNRGLHLRRELASCASLKLPDGASEEQRHRHEASMGEHAREAQAVADKLGAAAGPYADGVRFAFAAPLVEA